MTRPLILISDSVPNPERYRLESQNDIRPRLDYMEIARRTGGTVRGHNVHQNLIARPVHVAEKRLKFELSKAVEAALHLSDHSLLLSGSERTGLPLAMLLALTGVRKPHVLIAHHMSSPAKARLFRLWPIHLSFQHILCVSRAQVDHVTTELATPEDRVDFVYDKVDHCFFRPLKPDGPSDYVLAVGQEQRDYSTLLQALAGTGIKLVIVASSHWSNFRVDLQAPEGPVVLLENIPYLELRRLYANARLVVVPLHDVDYAAGVNTMLEAMAMAKPLVVSASRGVREYVAHDQTGRWVDPEDPEALRETVLSMWEAPHTLKRLGDNARQAVARRMNLDLYVDHIHAALENAVPQRAQHKFADV